jgi:hypothetical protein
MLKRLRLFLLVTIFVFDFPHNALAQTANASVGLTSLVTGQLSTPTAPLIATHGTAGSSTWSYAVVGVDLAGGNTPVGPNGSIATGNLNLSTSNYNIVTTPVVGGAASCDVYRTGFPIGGSPSTTGKIGNVMPCGGTFNDTAIAGVGSAPTANTTGSMNISGNLQTVNEKATGTVTAQSFVAQGSTAGGDTWVGGTAAGSVLGNSVTFEAPMTVTGGTSGAYVVLLPSSYPSANGVMLFGAGTGTVFKTSLASFGSLTDPSSTTLATTLGGSLTNGNFASIASASADFADSGISAISQSANMVLAGPSTGSAAAPAFRSLVVADVPSTAAFVSFCASTVGTATSTTYVLAPYAQTTSNCNATTVTEMPMPHAGTAKNLYVIASAAGKDSTSGVVTLYANAATTALTCTLGTSTSCHDITDTASFTAGESFSVRVKTSTTNSNDTTANIRVTFDYQ